MAHALKINRPSTPKQNELERGNGDDEACPLECVSSSMCHVVLNPQHLER